MPVCQPSPQERLFYQDHQPSSPKAILLLHGLGATSQSWMLQVPELVKHGYRCIAPDVPGFGESSALEGGFSLPAIASRLVALITELGLTQIDVAGISMGGVIAQQLTANYPERVARLILINTFARLRPKSLSAWFYFALRLILVYSLGLRSQAKVVARRMFPEPGQETLRAELIREINQAQPPMYRAAMASMGRINLEGRLAAFHNPVLIISGELDNTVPLPNQLELVRSIPQAKQVIIPGAGHAVIATHPEQTTRAMIAFLNGD